MTAVLQYAVIGLGVGAVYALLAQGLVLIHRGSGVINFSQGAIAVLAAFLFGSLVNDHGWGVWPAFAVLVVAGGLVGALIYLVIMRRLKGSALLARVIASLGVLVIIQAIATLKWENTQTVILPFLPTDPISVGSVATSTGSLILLGLAIALTAVLWASFRYFLPALATRAVAENRRAASALGWSPDALAAINWMLGGTLAAAAGILIAPLTVVQVSNMTVLLDAALAAALMARFSSFPIALGGALLLGIGQSEASNYVSAPGVADSVPFILVVVYLVVTGRGLPLRDHLVERFASLGTGVIRGRLLIGLSVVVAALMVGVLSSDITQAVTTSLAFGIVLLSIVLLTGFTGQLSLAQLTLGGVGALIAARLVASAGWPFLPAAIVGIIATVVVGLIFALPALRTRGMTLAIVTFGLASVISEVIFGNGKYIAGTYGTKVGPQNLFGFSIDSDAHAARYGILTLLVFVVCLVVVTNVRRGGAGRSMIAVRTNERGAAALGVSIRSAKLYAFALSAAMAGIGGVLIGFQFQTVTYDAFDPFQSIVLTGYAVIGGIGYAIGALPGSMLVVGGLGSWIADKIFGQSFETYLPLIGGIALVTMLMQDADGIASLHSGQLAQLRRRFRPGDREGGTTLQGAPSGSNGQPAGLGAKVPPRQLDVRDLVVRFGGTPAVNGVSLAVRPGEVLGLIGPNGAGKTTVIDAITGFVKPAAGSILLDGDPLGSLRTHQRARLGVVRSFQSLELFEDITVRENLAAAADRRDLRSYGRALLGPEKVELPPAVLASIAEFGLGPDLDKRPSDLPYGRRRLVAIARAVASAPSILLLDEPAAGLEERETRELAALVRRLATQWGIGILLVEHDMSFVMSVCDVVCVMDFGQKIAEGTPQEIRRSDRVIAAYLGDADDEAPPPATGPSVGATLPIATETAP